MMKRILVTAILILAFTASVSAQSYDRLGLKAGVNMFKLYGDDAEDLDYLTSFAFGGYYCHGFSDVFALQPELYYSMKGTSESEVITIDLKEGYIEIPVLLKVNFPMEGKSWSPTLFAGPYMAFLMSAKLEDIDVKDEVAGTDFGLVVGGGFDFGLSEGQQILSLDVRYSMGFTKIDEEGEADVMNNGFQLLLGFGFSL
jgi:hypothetical protein